MASLFSACKSVVRNNSGGTFNIGGYDIDIEYYSQQDIDNDFTYGDVAFGDSDESKIVLVAGSTITIPEGYTLTPDSPKKSLVIFCNNLVNNGTISMYQKAPNVLPHDYLILESSVAGTAKDIVIPAYADNAVTIKNISGSDGDYTRKNGIAGTNRQCGSGGIGCALPIWSATSGQGYAFGGGAGVGGILSNNANVNSVVDQIYPMRGGNAQRNNSPYYFGQGGVGNPTGTNTDVQHWGSTVNNGFGCGGRIIIFCCNFTNNGTINVNGTNTIFSDNDNNCYGGASGAGAIDLFYTNKIIEGSLIANGGAGGHTLGTSSNMSYYTGSGGNGSITLSQWSQTKLFKTEAKYFSQANINYLLTQLSDRIKESHMGE